MEKMTVSKINELLSEMELLEACKWLESIKDNYGATVHKLSIKYKKKYQLYLDECERLKKMSIFEREGYKKGFKLIGGIDEAGRGPLAGPVVAACVILPEGTIIEKLNDSKKLSEKVRNSLYTIIKQKAISYGIGIVGPEYIDKVNILNATKKAMEIAVDALTKKPDYLLIDAVKLENVNIEQFSMNKGDSLSISIAAASILAKVTRDRIISKMDIEFPQYGFAQHKGYGTKQHIEAIKAYGICPIHRKTFTKNFMSV